MWTLMLRIDGLSKYCSWKELDELLELKRQVGGKGEWELQVP